jgi:hypothetical protein
MNLPEDFTDGDVEVQFPDVGEEICECCGKKYTPVPIRYDGHCDACLQA